MRKHRVWQVAIVLISICCAVQAQAPLRLKSGDRIVALGDSITQAGGYLSFMKNVLDRNYPDLHIEIINAGIGGHKSTDMSARLQRDVIDKRPTVVTVSCGVNDVWHGFYDPPRGVDLGTYTRLMTKIVDDIRAATGAEIYLLTPTVIKEDLRSAENARLEAYCEALRRIASDKRCRLVDLNDLFTLTLRSTQTGGAPDFHPTSDGVHMQPAGDFLMGAAILRAMGVPISAILRETYPAAAQVPASDSRIQYWGRWDLRNSAETGAVTVNTGSTIICAFRGSGASLHFTTSHYPQQFPSLWLQVDGEEWTVVNPAEELKVARDPLPQGTHTVRVVVKGFREWERRWDPPLESSVVFRGITLASGGELVAPPPRPARLIEYLGDSITEGVLVLVPPGETRVREKWPQYSDGRRTWAYESALMLGAEPRIVGFGRLGLSVNANGGVPPGTYSLPFVYSGVAVDKTRQPDAVVVNMGTNDRGVTDEVFGPLYRHYIQGIRRMYPAAAVYCMRPFAGDHGAEIQKSVETLRQSGDNRVFYVDTTGWIDVQTHTTDRVHLNLEGNHVAAGRLAAELKAVVGGQ